MPRLMTCAMGRAPLAANGDPLQWDPMLPHASVLTSHGQEWKLDTPLLVLAHGLWSTLPQQLLTVHYGDVFVWNGTGAEPWVRLDPLQTFPDARVSLDAYTASLNSAQFTWPQQAVQAVEQIAGWTSGPWLVHARAPGWSSIDDLRDDSTVSHIAHARRGASLPVNFDAIARHASALGWTSAQARMPDRSVSQCVGGPRAAIQALGTAIQPRWMDESNHCAQAIDAVLRLGNATHALTILRLCDYDPRLIQACASPLRGVMVQLDATQLEAWAKALRLCWQVCPPALRAEIASDMATLALECHAVDLARDACARLHNGASTNPAHWKWIAGAHEASGRPHAARRAWARVRAHDPAHSAEGLARVTLRTRSELRQTQCSWDSRGIRLEPLDHAHARAVLHQFRDPQIAVMVALPRWDNESTFRKWLDEQERGHMLWAAVHRRLGLVGFASIGYAGTLGFFSFWVGPGFQGRGYSKSIAGQARESAARAGLDMLVTSVYDDNVRSLRALSSCGYSRISLRAKPPDESRQFLFAPSPGFHEMQAPRPAQIARRIIDYCHAQPGAMRFSTAPDCVAGPEPTDLSIPNVIPESAS